MNTDTFLIVINGMSVDVVRKAIKNLHLGVYPPHGRVRVAAPISMPDDAIRLAIISRLSWIKRQKSKFEAQARQTERQYISGETHYLFGRRYRLGVVHHSGAARVTIKNNTSIQFRVPVGSDTAFRERVFHAWYRQQLKALLPDMIAHWSERLQVPIPVWGVKRMKTKWGSCNIAAGRIWLNLELAKKSTQCLEYIVVHELIHFLERHHNDRFVALVDGVLPHWRLLRDELNEGPLGAESWDY